MAEQIARRSIILGLGAAVVTPSLAQAGKIVRREREAPGRDGRIYALGHEYRPDHLRALMTWNGYWAPQKAVLLRKEGEDWIAVVSNRARYGAEDVTPYGDSAVFIGVVGKGVCRLEFDGRRSERLKAGARTIGQGLSNEIHLLTVSRIGVAVLQAFDSRLEEIRRTQMGLEPITGGPVATRAEREGYGADGSIIFKVTRHPLGGAGQTTRIEAKPSGALRILD